MSRLAEGICTAALGEYKDKGFTAHETDDHLLVIEHYGKEIARYNVTKVELEEVKQDCHQHYNEDILLGSN